MPRQLLLFVELAQTQTCWCVSIARRRPWTSASTAPPFIAGRYRLAGAGFGTPAGTFRPQRMAARWFSTVYYNAPMPHAIFFHGGYAIHGSYDTARSGRTRHRTAASACIQARPPHCSASCSAKARTTPQLWCIRAVLVEHDLFGKPVSTFRIKSSESAKLSGSCLGMRPRQFRGRRSRNWRVLNLTVMGWTYVES